MLETNTILLTLILLLVGVLLLGLLVLIFRPPTDKNNELIAAVRSLVQNLQQAQTEIAVMNEKVTHLEPIAQTIQSTMTRSLGEVQQGIGAIDSFLKARQEIEQRTSTSIFRLEAVIAGTQTKGASSTGSSISVLENSVYGVSAQLQPPPEVPKGLVQLDEERRLKAG